MRVVIESFQQKSRKQDRQRAPCGDLGNIKSDENGNAKIIFKDEVISLKNNKRNIIGRCLVIHEDEDDCGKGGHHDSLITGHAGGRRDCAVIGICK